MIKENIIEEIYVPADRLAVIIGTKGETRKKIEKAGDVKLWVDTESNFVKVIGKDAYQVYIVKKVIKAIGRGFNPDKALAILNDGYDLELIDLRDFGAKEKKDLYRLRGRVIGERGATRKYIEKLSGCEISIYGKTVAIVGPSETINVVRLGLEMILTGARQGRAYAFIKEKLGVEK
jgi:ribosomal RNA assembly protein